MARSPALSPDEILAHEVWKALSRARRSPQKIISAIEADLQKFKQAAGSPAPSAGMMPARENRRALHDATHFLETQKPLRSLKWDKDMAMVATFQAEQLVSSRRSPQKAVPSKDSRANAAHPTKEMAAFCTQSMTPFQNTGNVRAVATRIILDLIIHDENGCDRLRIFNDCFQSMAVGVATSRNAGVCVIHYGMKVMSSSLLHESLAHCKQSIPIHSFNLEIAAEERSLKHTHIV
jgi:hypothetical protein